MWEVGYKVKYLVKAFFVIILKVDYLFFEFVVEGEDVGK